MIDEIPNTYNMAFTNMSEGELAIAIDDYDITHMYIQNGAKPPLDVIAPRLSQLKVEGIHDSTELQKYVIL